MEFQRFNPFCSKPVVAIKNTGSTTLTEADIIYGRKDGQMSTFHWTGSLNFLEVTEVSLPVPDWQTSLSNKFIARVSNPNGGTDQYAQNDTMYSDFNLPPVYASTIVIELQTNSAGYQNQLYVKDSDGNTVFSRTSLINNHNYRDTLQLAGGCYTLSLTDNGDNGLYFWNETSQGAGYFRIWNLDTLVVKSFNPDFGDNVFHQFTIGLVLPVAELPKPLIHSFEVYPNPSTGNFVAEFSLPLQSRAELKVVNILGQTLIQQDVMVTQDLEKFTMDGSNLDDGFYFVVLQTGDQRQTRKVVIRH